jgi:hypothetical protein
VARNTASFGCDSGQQDQLGSETQGSYLAGKTGPGIMLQGGGPRIVPTLYGGIVRQELTAGMLSMYLLIDVPAVCTPLEHLQYPRGHHTLCPKCCYYRSLHVPSRQCLLEV